MARPLSVLIVEDRETDAALLLRALKRGGYEATYERVDTEEAMTTALQRRAWDIVVSDCSMPHFSALGAARLVAKTDPDLPLIVVSGTVGEEAAVDIMRAGARDFILKTNFRRLVPAIERELDAAQTRRDKRSADEGLDRERELLRQLMEGIPDAIFFKDLDRRYMHLNDAERQVLAVASEEDVIGRTADHFISPERARRRREVEERVLATGQPAVDCIEKMVAADGACRWVSATEAPIRDHHGTIVGLVGIARDITERKRQEQLKDEFVATVSHELRTPLTSIAGTIGMLTSEAVGVLPEPARRLIDIAHRNCQRLARIVNDILDMEKIEAGEMRFDVRPIELRALIEQTIESLQGFARHHGASVRLDDAAPRVEALADPDRLGQVMANLLSNALKFSPPGGEVVVSVGSDRDAARISVRDHGPGIPDDYKHRIFEKFVQVDATDARKKGGTGLGLSIARQIVVNLGGRIDIEDAPDGGTTFHVTLPIAKSDCAKGAIAHEQPLP
jgi:PAS domain S-box-containing protein